MLIRNGVPETGNKELKWDGEEPEFKGRERERERKREMNEKDIKAESEIAQLE